MALPRVSPSAYRKATFAALLLLCIIVVTGAAVRLTESGLGCSDWPKCSETKAISVSSYHEAIEQLNRLFTGLVSVGVAAAVLGSIRRLPKRQDLVTLSWGLVAGVLGQIVLGGILVKFELHPILVQGHFLLSIILVTNAVVLHHRAGHTEAPPVPAASRTARRLGHALVVAAAAVLAAGTVVTGTGPHGGDEKARRLGFQLDDVARIHGATVIILIALTIGIALLLRREQASPATQKAVVALLAIEVAQGALGYWQYFNAVPPLAVGFHVAGSVAVWIAVMRVRLALWSRPLLSEIST